MSAADFGAARPIFLSPERIINSAWIHLFHHGPHHFSDSPALRV